MTYEKPPVAPSEAMHETFPETQSWETLWEPVTLGFADESGAVFHDNLRRRILYLDINEMTFREMQPEDLHRDRLERLERYPIPKETPYESGAVAAVNVRIVHLEHQIHLFEAISDDKNAKFIIDSLEEELGFLRAYLAETDPRERALLTNDLNQMYADMRSTDDMGEREEGDEEEMMAAK